MKKKCPGQNQRETNSFQFLLSLLNQKLTLRLMKKLFFSIAVCFLTANVSNAQTNNGLSNDTTKLVADIGEYSISEADTSSARRMNEVIVTASRLSQKIDDAGRSVTVISAKDIASSGANTLAELLNLAEGIYITGSQQNFGSNQSLFMRGANSNQSVIMMDGIPLNDPSTPTNALDLSELSLSEIDQIEIVRGSHSTLYGSSAIGGVINIITKKKQKVGMNLNVTGTAGSFGKETSLISQNIGMNYTFKSGFYTNVHFNNMNVNGIDATIDTSTIPGMPRDMDGMSHFDFGGKAGYKTAKWDVNIYGKKTERSADIDDREFDDDDNYKLDFERTLVAYSASYKADSSLMISVNGGHSFISRISLNDSSRTDNLGNYDHSYYRGEYTGETFTNEAQLQLNKKNFNLILGGGSNTQKMNQNIFSYYQGFEFNSDLDSLDLISSTSSFFLLTELNGALASEKLKTFSLSLGARNNNNNTFGNSVTYQISPRIKLSANSSVYGNISSGYNAPSLYQLHSPDRDFNSAIARGNINLRPETSVTKEFGIYQKLDDNTSIRMGFFKTVVNDVIEYVYMWDKNTAINSLSYANYRGDTYLNLGKLTTEGIEVVVHCNMGKKFVLDGNFSWLRGKQDFVAADIDTVKTHQNHIQLYTNGQFLTYKYRETGLTRRPVTANISVTYKPSSIVFIKSVIRYVSKKNDVYYENSFGPYGALGTTPVQAYTLLDLLAGIKFNKNISALVRIENVLNESYSEIRGFSSRGRGYYFSLNYTF